MNQVEGKPIKGSRHMHYAAVHKLSCKTMHASANCFASLTTGVTVPLMRFQASTGSWSLSRWRAWAKTRNPCKRQASIRDYAHLARTCRRCGCVLQQKFQSGSQHCAMIVRSITFLKRPTSPYTLPSNTFCGTVPLAGCAQPAH